MEFAPRAVSVMEPDVRFHYWRDRSVTVAALYRSRRCTRRGSVTNRSPAPRGMLALMHTPLSRRAFLQAAPPVAEASSLLKLSCSLRRPWPHPRAIASDSA